MSNLKRYYLDDYGVLIEHPNGEYVLHSDYARLKADVERLRKAGDKLVEAIQEMDVIIDMDSNHPEVSAWNAAKEGKQP